MNKRVYISKNYRHIFTATAKAKMDAEKIVNNNGWCNIGLPARNIENEFLGRLWTLASNAIAYLRMPKNGYVFLQYPVNLSHSQIRRAAKRGNKIVVLVHDLNTIRDEKNNKDFEYLMYSDIIIVHTQAMKDWLQDKFNLIKDIRILGIFDYLKSKSISEAPPFPINICFAGNLAKSSFLHRTRFNNIQLKLFGIGGENLPTNKGLYYVGCFPPEELSEHLNSHFGLVWDGNTTDTCSGILGDYLRLNSPHKLSMYLSSGMPVIVWKESAMAPFINNEGVGISISKLSELDCILPQITEDEYRAYKRNAIVLSDLSMIHISEPTRPY